MTNEPNAASGDVTIESVPVRRDGQIVGFRLIFRYWFCPGYVGRESYFVVAVVAAVLAAVVFLIQ